MEAMRTALVVQPGEAAGASLKDGAFELLADGGAVSASRLTLATGADGAPPHHHKLSHELFYVLDGTMLFRLGDTLTTVGKGGLVVVPPGLPHVFGAAEGEVAAANERHAGARPSVPSAPTGQAAPWSARPGPFLTTTSVSTDPLRPAA